MLVVGSCVGALVVVGWCVGAVTVGCAVGVEVGSTVRPQAWQ